MIKYEDIMHLMLGQLIFVFIIHCCVSCVFVCVYVGTFYNILFIFHFIYLPV